VKASFEKFEDELRKLIEEKEKKEREELEKRANQKTLIAKKVTPRSENAIIILTVSFYVPLILLSPYVAPLLPSVVKTLASAVAVLAAFLWLGLTIAKGYNERISYNFVELYILRQGKAKREHKIVQVLKTVIPLYSSIKETDYDAEKVKEEIQRGNLKKLPVHVAMFLANDRKDDFILVTRGFKPLDALQWDVTEVNGKWSTGLGTFSPANIVKEYMMPVKRPEYDDEVPVYFLLSNPKYCQLTDGPLNVLEGMEPEEIIKTAAAYGMYDGMIYREKYIDAETRNKQLAKILDESKGEALRLAAKAAMIRKADLAAAISAAVSQEVEEVKEKTGIKKKLFDTRLKKALWVIFAGISLALILALTVPWIISLIM